jgi:hypothetical protein
MERETSVFRDESANPSDGDNDENDDIDLPIYESGDESFGNDEDDESDEDEEVSTVSAPPASRLAPQLHPAPQNGSHPWQLSADEPWPGLEDRDHSNHPNIENMAPWIATQPQDDDHHSDSENVDPNTMDVEHESDNSSQPSEYPSTQRAWPNEAGDAPEEFNIHRDD